MKENSVQRLVWLGVGQLSRLFRLNTGRAWLSNLGPKGVERLADGSVLIRAARSISMGFATPSGDPVVGASDLIGITTITITPDMVGREVGVFTAIETKREKGGRTSEDQSRFLDVVRSLGGIAAVARDQDDARQAILSFNGKPSQRNLW